MKNLTLILFLLSATSALAQLKVVKVDKQSIPASVHYPGQVVDAIKYTDNDGEHLIITTKTGEVTSKTKDCDDCRNADLCAFNYRMDTSGPTLIWQVHDFVKDCPFDITARFLANTFAVTDLDNNGTPEIWLMYRVTCTSDVSPVAMKIIMYQGKQKYAVRGTARVLVSTNPVKYLGGEHTPDDAFKSAPETFKQYAEQLWKSNLTVDWKN